MNEYKNEQTGCNEVSGSSENCKGALLFLKTPLETRSRNPLIDVYITVVPIRKASSTLDLIRKILPGDGGLDLQHLRRFAKLQDLPEAVRSSILAVRNPTSDDNTDFLNDRILIAGPTNLISQQSLIKDLSSILDSVPICSIPVPLLAPTSQEQAILWTSTYWPSVYKKSNPFGPHFAVITKAENDMREDVEKWMNIAEDVAMEASTTGSGERIGVVIVERRNGIARSVVVAGDARWQEWPRNSSGNATAHAALRAIAMVAAGLKLREEAEQETKYTTQSDDTLIFQSQPLGKIEQENYHPSTSIDGYLCHDLEIYCTHEPCVMCSMAIMHSRFGKVIFKHRMPRTGGMCADGELGHGLFWRKELNWQLLAWQWSPPNLVSAEDASTQLLHA